MGMGFDWNFKWYVILWTLQTLPLAIFMAYVGVPLAMYVSMLVAVSVLGLIPNTILILLANAMGNPDEIKEG